MFVNKHLFLLLAAGWLITACARPTAPQSASESNGSPVTIAHAEPIEIGGSSDVTVLSLGTLEDGATTLTLTRTLEIAFEKNPTYPIFEAHLKAARAEVIRALAYPNPEFEGSLGVAESRDEPVERRAEYGLSLVQPLESPLKRRTRVAAAEALEVIDEREHDVFAVMLRAETTQAFQTILYYERAANLADENARIALEIQDVVGRRVDSGEAPEIDRIKARVEVLKSSRAAQALRRSLASARVVLNALCGEALPQDFRLDDSANLLQVTLNESDAVKASLESHPELMLLATKVEGQQAVINREKAAWRPDLKPGVSLGRGFGEDSAALMLGIQIPIWNRNQGTISVAEAELEVLQAELAKMQIEVLRDIRTAFQGLESAREQIGAFDSGLRADASEALKVETFLYEQGETDFLQLLDARRTAQETEVEYLQAIYDMAIAAIELDRALGKGELAQ